MSSTRIVARRPATLAHRFSAEGAAGVSVIITDIATGLALASTAPVADAQDPQRWTTVIAADALPAVTRLEVAWSGGNGWIETDYVDVVGGRYADPADVLAAAGVGTIAEASDALASVEARIETYCKVAFVPVYATEEARTTIRDEAIVLEWPELREIRSLSVDGAALDVADLEITVAGIVRRPAGGFTPGKRIEVGYIHGLAAPPPDLADAAHDVAVQLLRDDANRHVPKRAEFAEGTSWVIATASPEHGRLFGIPTIDAVISLYRRHTVAVA